MKTAGSKATAKSRTATAKKLRHVVLSPMENGMMAEHHYMEPEQEMGKPYMSAPEPTKHALMSHDEMADHLKATFPNAFPEGKKAEGDEKKPEGKKTAKVKGVGKPKSHMEPDTKEPDDDEDDEG